MSHLESRRRRSKTCENPPGRSQIVAWKVKPSHCKDLRSWLGQGRHFKHLSTFFSCSKVCTWVIPCNRSLREVCMLPLPCSCILRVPSFLVMFRSRMHAMTSLISCLSISMYSWSSPVALTYSGSSLGSAASAVATWFQIVTRPSHQVRIIIWCMLTILDPATCSMCACMSRLAWGRCETRDVCVTMFSHFSMV